MVIIIHNIRLLERSSDSTSLTQKIIANEIPAIEVKGSGEHGIIFCSPSVHKNGCSISKGRMRG